MELQCLQTVFAQTPSPAPTLAAALPNPTVAGNTLSLYLRFSPLTGTPLLTDSYGNPYRRSGIVNLSDTQAVGLWTAEILRGGNGHIVTATSQGGLQSLELGISELSATGPTMQPGPGLIPCPVPGPTQPRECQSTSTDDILLAIFAQQAQQTALLQRLVTAARAKG